MHYQRDQNKNLEVVREHKGQHQSGDEGAHVEQTQDLPGFLGHIFELSLGSGEEAGSRWGQRYPVMLRMEPME